MDKRIQQRHFISSVVLGLNDALVELTGSLAGLTLALQNVRLIAMVGIITGIAASLSMTASQYFATQQEDEKRAGYSAIVTGLAYITTVLILVAPYLFMHNAFSALFATILIAVVIIALFNFYTSVAKRLPFFYRFSKMVMISLGIAAINFGIGFLVKKLFGI